MPIEIYKDEEGKEKQRYVLPESVSVKEETQAEGQQPTNVKPDEDSDLGDAIGRTLAQGGRDFVQNIYDSIGMIS